jgi:hypothetical protein
MLFFIFHNKIYLFLFKKFNYFLKPIFIFLIINFFSIKKIPLSL